MKAQPSVVYKIADDVAAWCFDRVVVSFGAEVEADLDKINDKNTKTAESKRQRRLEKWLGIAPRFKDPAAR